MTWCLALGTGSALAEQPIFDEMPRWSGGYGVQLLYDYRHNALEDPSGSLSDAVVEKTGHRFHVQGVYTWQRWIRLTAKLPYLIHEQRKIGSGSNDRSHAHQGLGNLTLALPLKRYFNLDGRSGSWTIGPQLQVPTALGAHHRQTALGLSLGYETESYRWHYGMGTTVWSPALRQEVGSTEWNRMERPIARLQMHLGFNMHAWESSGHFKIHSYLRWGETDAYRLTVGPVLYWRFTDLVHGQAVWWHDVWDGSQQELNPQSYGDLLRLGIGFVL